MTIAIPYVAALIAGAWCFLIARRGMALANLDWMVGIVPVLIGAITTLHLSQLLRIQPKGQRDLGRLALVAGAALAFLTVAIPLQLRQQWITIGWALEGAAVAWLYTRIPHRGLLLAAVGLLGAVFVRLALNPSVFVYEPRGEMRIVNWYLYTYVVAALAMGVAAWFLAKTDDQLADDLPRPRHLLPAAAGILLFLLLNIEIADYYSTGPEILFRFGSSIQQDLTYTIAWLIFGIITLAVGIICEGASGARDRRGVDRGHRVQVFPLRPRLARRVVSRRCLRRLGGVARARVPGVTEIRAGARKGGRAMTRRFADADRGDAPTTATLLAQGTPDGFSVSAAPR